MTERERLKNLVFKFMEAATTELLYGGDFDDVFTDYLLKNGVIVPPCKIGDKIYVIPSKANYKLNIVNGYTENNRIYEQIVDAIHIYLTGYTLSCCEGLQPQPSALYGETWFLSREEAEKALKVRGK